MSYLAPSTRRLGPSAVALLASCVLLTSCRSTADRAAVATETPSVAASEAVSVTSGPLVRSVVTADGILVAPVPPQPLGFTMSGEVLEVDVSEGQEVRQGDALARMDLLPFDLSLAQARAALAQAEDALTRAQAGPSTAQLAAAQAEVAASEATLARTESGVDVENARLDVERAKNSLWGVQAQRDAICGAAKRKFASQAECDAAQANVQAAEVAERALAAARSAQPQNLETARARLASARASLAELRRGPSAGELASLRQRVEQAQLAVAAAEADRARAVLTAPFDGSVAKVHIAPGTRVGPGAPVVTLAKTRPLALVTTNLSERYVGQVSVGAKAVVVLTAYPDHRLEAQVERIAPQAETDPAGAVVVPVYLKLDDRGLPLRAGMTGRVEKTHDFGLMGVQALAQQALGVVERQRLHEGFRRQPRPAAKQMMQLVRRQMRGVGDGVRRRLRAPVFGNESDGAAHGFVIAQCRALRRWFREPQARRVFHLGVHG